MEQMSKTQLQGRRILIIEDSPVVAPFTVEVLEELGCEVAGIAPNLASAREYIEKADFDAALVDIHIRGERVFNLCDILEARGIPFVLTSGYAASETPDKWQGVPRLQKPYTFEQVQRVLEDLFERQPD